MINESAVVIMTLIWRRQVVFTEQKPMLVSIPEARIIVIYGIHKNKIEDRKNIEFIEEINPTIFLDFIRTHLEIVFS